MEFAIGGVSENISEPDLKDVLDVPSQGEPANCDEMPRVVSALGLMPRPLAPPRRFETGSPRTPGEIDARRAQRADEHRLHRARLLSWAHLSERKG